MSFTNEMIQAVWEKGFVVSGYDPDIYRKDQCGAWIKRDMYGNRQNSFGWEIDHISPGGEDILSNLRPLQWQNNVDKSDGRLKCNVVAVGASNVDMSILK